MLVKSLALVAGATIAAADSTVTLFLPGFDAQSLDGKILGSSGAMTTYVLNCPPSQSSDNCPLPDMGYTVIGDSTSVVYNVGYDSETIDQTCKLEGTTSVACWAQIVSGDSTSVVSTEIGIATMPYGGFQPVHITATQTGGVPASTGASASASTASQTSDASASETATPTAAATTGASTGSASQSTKNTASAASTSASHSSNAALPMMTGNAIWVAGGAAAALALVAV